MLTDRKKEIIIKKIKRALAKQPIKIAYLYGSFATGLVRRGKDIDIAVVLEPKANKFGFQIAGDIHTETIGSGYPEIDVREINLETSPLFLRNVLKDKILLLSRNERERIDFEVAAMKKYQDSNYIRNFMVSKMYKAIKENKYGYRQTYD